MYNFSKIKKDFPFFATNPKLVYLDSASTSQKPQIVIDALNEHYANINANIHRGIYAASEEATRQYEEARKTVAKFIGAPSAQNIIFTRNTTEAINFIAYTYAKNNLKAGDEILLTHMEHHSNIVPWYLLAKEKKLKLQFVRLTKDGKLDMKDVKKKTTKKVRLAAFTHISNVLGTINPVKELTAFFHSKGIPVLIDGAQAVPHMKVNVTKIDCDFYAFSGHKMLAPSGIGVLYMKEKYLNSLPPFLGGGEMIQSVSTKNIVFQNGPAKFEAGTPAIEEVIALGVAIEYLEQIGMNEIERFERQLTVYAYAQLKAIPEITLYGPKDAKSRSGVISFNLKNIHPHDLSSLLDSKNIALRAGSHCAMPLHDVLGVPATCRMSLYIYNTKKDIDTLCSALRTIAKKINT